MADDLRGKARHSSFSIYLRTGRHAVASAPASRIEAKFNPWHDPDDGKFTFAGGGRFFGPGGSSGRRSASGPSGAVAMAKPPAARTSRPEGSSNNDIRGNNGDFGGGGSSGRYGFAPDDAGNYSIYVVRSGDNLTKIARSRRGLRASDLAWLNGIPEQSTLHIGQELKVPTQAYLEAGKAARDRFLNLSFFMAMHDGKLPPDVTKVPSIQEQLDTDWKTVILNGHVYKIDLLQRVRDLRTRILPSPKGPRSKSAQKNAGGPDRRPTDDGGHYVAPRFDGSLHPINHFPQDRSFNRGIYRVIEDGWDKARKAGKAVDVHIVPHFHGTSLRPYELVVEWKIDGKKHLRVLPNEKRKQKR